MVSPLPWNDVPQLDPQHSSIPEPPASQNIIDVQHAQPVGGVTCSNHQPKLVTIHSNKAKTSHYLVRTSPTEVHPHPPSLPLSPSPFNSIGDGMGDTTTFPRAAALLNHTTDRSSMTPSNPICSPFGLEGPES